MDTIRYYIMPLTTLTGVIGFLIGGSWIWMAAGTYIVLMAGDVFLPKDIKPRERTMPWWGIDAALYLQAPLLVALYVAFLSWFFNDFNLGAPYAWLQIVGCILGIGWLSVVPTLPIAHELWHRRHWFPRAVSRFLGIFYMDPAKDVGHNIGHHNLVSTAKDCDTPRRGQTLYAFVVQARLGSWRDTFRASNKSLRAKGKSPWNWRHVGYQQLLMPVALAVVCFLVAGPLAAAISIGAMIMGNFFMEGLNYMQHYGLIRVEDEDIQIHHAWNHLGAVVRPLGCEITNHINHHLDSYTRFEALRPETRAPQMPSLFICFLTGLVPPLWNRMIAQPRLRHWDKNFANDKELKLAREQHRRVGWPDWFAQGGMHEGTV